MANNDPNFEQNTGVKRLREAMTAQRSYLAGYETPCETIAYETLRTFDDLFCRDLMEPTQVISADERMLRAISTWGVNHAPRRVVPRNPMGGMFRDFPSYDGNQQKADDFVFKCGTLALAERFEGWLEEGLLTAELRGRPQSADPAGILVLRTGRSSCYDDEIGRAGLRWASDLIWQEDREAELALEERHREIAPELERHVHLRYGWQINYSSTREIDDYFLDWGKLYLRRIFSQDLLGLDDVIGGRPFSQYLDVLTALSARSQKHVAFAAILLARHPKTHIRNLLTTYSPRSLFVESLASYMEADSSEVDSILKCFTLAGDNLDVHTMGSETAWAPIVQASTENIILPTYGTDINPFLFLLSDVRFRYEADWFRVANNRERRWIDELEALFPEPPWRTHGQNLRLRTDGKSLTDIDFAAYDADANELGLFQLKWQQPVGMENRARRSAGKNFIQASNQWLVSVTSWLDRHGVSELMQRLKFESPSAPKVCLFVLGRYQGHYAGYDERDGRGLWADWSHFRRVCVETQRRLSIAELASKLRGEVEHSRAMKRGERMAFPVGDLAVVLNPTSVPRDGDA